MGDARFRVTDPLHTRYLFSLQYFPTYLQIPGDYLAQLKSQKTQLWKIVYALACKDISKKMYETNDGFEKYLEKKNEFERKSLAKRIVRSESLDVLNISSHGFLVSENWFQVENRQSLLQCPHSWDGMPMKNPLKTSLMKRSLTLSNLNKVVMTVTQNYTEHFFVKKTKNHQKMKIPEKNSEKIQTKN